MPRTKITLPKTFSFSSRISIRITDINYGNHLGNDALLGLLHEARVRYLNQYGYSEKNIEGAGIIMADAVINYQSQGSWGQELIIEIAPGEPDRIGLDLFYRLTDKKSGQEVARAKTYISFFSYKQNKRVSPPPEFINKIKK